MTLPSRFFYTSIILTLLLACQQKPTNLTELNLINYGLPISIKAPADSEVKTMQFGLTKDVSIRKDEHFYIQIFASDIRTNKLQKVKEDLLSDVKSEPFFDSIIETREDGFIYKTVIDSSLSSYGFKAIKLIGNNEIIFGQGLIGSFSLDDVKKMYDAVSDKH